MPAMTLRAVSKRYGEVTAVEGVSLAVEEGELLALVGPSGCGKTTTCKMIAGLEEISSGDLLLKGDRVNDLAPEQRNVAMVFEDYALYPRMNVYENVAFPLRVRSVPRAERHEKVTAMLEKIELTDVAGARVQDLSGGQQQRVSIARALVRQPTVLIMDEPLSHLDVGLKGRLRSEIRMLQQQLGLTGVLVTHDQAEAMAMADRIAVMHHGVLRQCAAPHVVYDEPADMFVAGFIGEPPMNFLDARLRHADGEVRLEAPGLAFALAPELARRLERAGALDGADGREVVAGIRPEHVAVATPDADASGSGDVLYTEWVGAFQAVTLARPGATEPWLTLLADPAAEPVAGDRVDVAVDVGRLALFDADERGRNLLAGTPAQEAGR